MLQTEIVELHLISVFSPWTHLEPFFVFVLSIACGLVARYLGLASNICRHVNILYYLLQSLFSVILPSISRRSLPMVQFAQQLQGPKSIGTTRGWNICYRARVQVRILKSSRTQLCLASPIVIPANRLELGMAWLGGGILWVLWG